LVDCDIEENVKTGISRNFPWKLKHRRGGIRNSR
jgi:hypothetical protein